MHVYFSIYNEILCSSTPINKMYRAVNEACIVTKQKYNEAGYLV